MIKRVVLILIMSLVLKAQAQQVFKIIPENSIMKITGTSSLHDWQMKAEKIDCDVTVVTGNLYMTIKKSKAESGKSFILILL